ncbi:AEC family transporter [soil metagenome]
MALSVLSSIAEMFGLFAIGWIVNRLRFFEPADFDRLSRLVVEVLFPCLIFQSLVTGLDTARLGELWLLPLLGFGLMAVGGVCGAYLRRGLRSDDPGVAAAFHHICAINNYGFLPIFIITNSMVPEALALFFVFNLGSTVGYWTVGVIVLEPGGTTIRSTMRKLVSPSMVAIALGMLVALAGGREWMPQFVMRVTGLAGGISVPLILIIIGALLGASFRREHARDLVYITVLRVAVLPALYILLIWWLPLADDVRTICYIVSLMPAAATSVIMARVYGGSSEFAAAATVTTTIASIVTIPLALHLLLGG